MMLLSKTRNPAQQLRDVTSLSVQRLANLVGVSRSTFYKWLMNKKPIPYLHTPRLRELLAASQAGLDIGKIEAPSLYLTRREGDVLCLIAKGYKDEEIAIILCVRSNTVRQHIKHLLDKLFLANRTELAIYALKAGILTLDEIELRHTERK